MSTRFQRFLWSMLFETSWCHWHINHPTTHHCSSYYLSRYYCSCHHHWITYNIWPCFQAFLRYISRVGDWHWCSRNWCSRNWLTGRHHAWLCRHHRWMELLSDHDRSVVSFLDSLNKSNLFCNRLHRVGNNLRSTQSNLSLALNTRNRCSVLRRLEKNEGKSNFRSQARSMCNEENIERKSTGDSWKRSFLIEFDSRR